MEIVVAYQDGELVQHCLVKGGSHCSQAALRTCAWADEDIVTVDLEDGVKAVQSP